MNKKKKAVNHSCYPDGVIERLARCFYPAILESFNNEEDQKAFAAWQAEQARCLAKENQDVPDGERPDIHTQLFQVGCVLRGAPVLFAFESECFPIAKTAIGFSGCHGTIKASAIPLSWRAISAKSQSKSRVLTRMQLPLI